MEKLVFSLCLVLNITSCGALSTTEIEQIGRQIWQNEASGKEELLVFWNKNEDFPSLGIGHNVWFPQGQAAQYSEGFPLLCQFLKEHGVVLPSWLEQALKTGAPWQTRELFYQDLDRTQQLKQLLVSTIELQTEFMLNRFEQKLPLIIAAADPKQRKIIQKNIDLMLSTPAGTYALVDYLNFKGDGLNSKEALKGMRWGLLAVLQDMPQGLTQNNVVKAFAASAAKKLLLRIENSGPDYKLITFLHGWMKRISTYVEYGGK